jgi:hypothetical protein
MRLAYVSSVLPLPYRAGELIMYNHFSRMKADQIFAVTSPGEKVLLPNVETYQTKMPRWHSVLSRFRCRPISDELLGIYIAFQCEAKVRRMQPQLLLTVWHGPFLFAAFRLSRRLNIPLVIVCHDDNEALRYGNGQFFKGWLRRRLSEVYSAASERLCVSEGMREEFKRRYGAGGRLLYPLSTSKLQNRDATNQNGLDRSGVEGQPLRIGYAGSYSPSCVPVLMTLLSILEKRAWQFHLASPTFDAARQSLRAFRCMNDLGVFRPEEVATYFSKNVDVMIIIQGFSDEERVLTKTNFPSKLVECAKYGLPLMIVAPSDSSSARWIARHPRAALWVHSPAESDIANALDLLGQAETRRQLAENLDAVAAEDFDSERIHQKFVWALEHATVSAISPYSN